MNRKMIRATRVFMYIPSKRFIKGENNLCQNLYNTIDMFQIDLSCIYETQKPRLTACFKKYKKSHL